MWLYELIFYTINSDTPKFKQDALEVASSFGYFGSLQSKNHRRQLR